MSLLGFCWYISRGVRVCVCPFRLSPLHSTAPTLAHTGFHITKRIELLTCVARVMVCRAPLALVLSVLSESLPPLPPDTPFTMHNAAKHRDTPPEYDHARKDTHRTARCRTERESHNSTRGVVVVVERACASRCRQHSTLQCSAVQWRGGLNSTSYARPNPSGSPPLRG